MFSSVVYLICSLYLVMMLIHNIHDMILLRMISVPDVNNPDQVVNDMNSNTLYNLGQYAVLSENGELPYFGTH